MCFPHSSGINQILNIAGRKFRITAPETFLYNFYHLFGRITKDKFFKVYIFICDTCHFPCPTTDIKPSYPIMIKNFYQLYDFFIKLLIIRPAIIRAHNQPPFPYTILRGTNYEKSKTLHCHRHFFRPDHRNTGAFYIRLVRKQHPNRSFYADQWIHMGAYEISIFSDAVICFFHDLPFEKRSSLYHIFSFCRNTGRDTAHPTAFLCLYRYSGQRLLCSGHRHIYCERPVRLFSFLSAYLILQSKTVHCISLRPDRYTFFQFYPVYLLSAGFWHICRPVCRNALPDDKRLTFRWPEFLSVWSLFSPAFSPSFKFSHSRHLRRFTFLSPKNPS